MRKLILALGVMMGMVFLSSQSYAMRAGDTTYKSMFNQALVSSNTNGNASFITGSSTATVTGGGQFCNNGTNTGFTGGVAGTLMACGPTPITGLSLSGGASGGTITIYDASTNGTQGGSVNGVNPAESMSAEVVFEATIAANTNQYIDLTNSPINTKNGVVAYANATSGVVVYTGTGIAANQ